MIKTRKAPLAAAVILILALLIAPLLSINASATGTNIYEGVKKSSGTYKAALLDADFYDSPDGCLSSSEEAAIFSLMQETADKIMCNIGIAIVSDLKGMNHIQYTEKFSDTMFGSHSDSVTLLLLNRHENPAYSSYTDWLFLNDRGDDLYDKKADQIFDLVYKALDRDKNDFYGACSNFCSALKKYNSTIGSIMPDFRVNGTLFMAMLAIGLLMSLIIVSSFRSTYKKKTPISAAHYIDKSRTRVNRQIDQFVREHTTSVHIDSSSGGHGGSHGGRSGGHSSHHSSGHGGRGR